MSEFKIAAAQIASVRGDLGGNIRLHAAAITAAAARGGLSPGVPGTASNRLRTGPRRRVGNQRNGRTLGPPRRAGRSTPDGCRCGCVFAGRWSEARTGGHPVCREWLDAHLRQDAPGGPANRPTSLLALLNPHDRGLPTGAETATRHRRCEHVGRRVNEIQHCCVTTKPLLMGLPAATAAASSGSPTSRGGWSRRSLDSRQKPLASTISPPATVPRAP
jgi:hypothetical protein